MGKGHHATLGRIRQPLYALHKDSSATHCHLRQPDQPDTAASLSFPLPEIPRRSPSNWLNGGYLMRVGNRPKRRVVEAFRMAFYSPRHPRASYTQGNQSDLGDPGFELFQQFVKQGYLTWVSSNNKGRPGRLTGRPGRPLGFSTSLARVLAPDHTSLARVLAPRHTSLARVLAPRHTSLARVSRQITQVSREFSRHVTQVSHEFSRFTCIKKLVMTEPIWPA